MLATVFDNWRVLHGRSAFTGKRRMCGGYSKITQVLYRHVHDSDRVCYAVNRDDFISKYRMTNISKKEIEASTVTG